MAINPVILFSMPLITPSSFPVSSDCLPCTMLDLGPAGGPAGEGTGVNL